MDNELNQQNGTGEDTKLLMGLDDEEVISMEHDPCKDPKMVDDPKDGQRMDLEKGVHIEL